MDAAQSSLSVSRDSVTADGADASTVSVTVVDSEGAPMANVAIAFSATGENNSWASVASVTDANGQATAVLASTSAESKSITATANGTVIEHGAKIAFVAGPPTQLAFVSPPSDVQALNPFTALTVAVQDNFGNVVTQAQTAVTIAVVNDATTLNGSTSVMPTNGLAAFSDVSLAQVGSYALVASTGSLSTTSVSFAVTAGAPSSLVFVASPSAFGAGQAVELHLRAFDAAGNPTDSFSAPVTLSSSVALHGTTTVVAAGGEAVFSNLSIRKAGAVDVTASSAGFAAAHLSVSVQAGAPALLDVVAAPSAGSVNNALANVVVHVEDSYGNLVTSATPVITAHVAQAGSGFAAQPINAVDGIATFSSLTIGQAGQWSFTFSAPLLVGAAIAPVNVNQQRLSAERAMHAPS